MLLVIVATPRTGSHLLRGMLAADPAILDLGAPLTPNDNLASTAPASAGHDDVIRWTAARFAENPDRDLLFTVRAAMTLNFEADWEIIRALLGWVGGRAVHLIRRDLLAQAASFALAAQTGQWHEGPAPDVASLVLPHAETVAGMARIDGINAKLRERLGGLRACELAYEDLLVPDLVADTLSALLGRLVTIGAPTTVKSAPPLESYVENLAAFGR